MTINIRTGQIAYIVIAISFVSSLMFHPYTGSWLVKPLPVLIMSLLCWKYLEGSERTLLTLGFIFSGLGDVFLDLDRTAFFKQGLLSFLVTQILFTVAFWKRRIMSKERWVAAALVALYSVIMIVLLWSSLGNLKIPVLIYILALTSMGMTAAFREGPLTGVYLGAFLFVIADSLIAVNKFLQPFDHSLMIIIGLYMTGQFFIGRGVLMKEGSGTQ